MILLFENNGAFSLDMQEMDYTWILLREWRILVPRSGAVGGQLPQQGHTRRHRPMCGEPHHPSAPATLSQGGHRTTREYSQIVKYCQNKKWVFSSFTDPLL